MAQPGRISRARRWWRTTPPLIRHFSIGLLVLGALLAGMGLWLDHTNWWEGHSFLVNLVSSLTSLCFGVPTALLILSHLGNAQTDARQARRARGFARAEVHEFQTALIRIFNVPSAAALASEARHLLIDLHHLRQLTDADGTAAAEWLRGFHALLDLPPGPSRGYRQPTSWAALAADRWQWGQVARWHVRVETQWRVLNDEVRPRAAEYGLPWLSKTSAAATEQAIRQLLSGSGRNPWHAQEPSSPQDAVAAMGHFLNDVRVLCAAADKLAVRYPPPAPPTAP
ncbi:hypothetical protein [Streptomyces sp. NPDC047829]|uniref:hypothetical protein n=1 Tax=Streptomyces sp. NPDC047829 TaxID=3154609 RepID=UPI00340EBC1B